MATETSARRTEADECLERGRIDRRHEMLEPNALGAERCLQSVDGLLFEPACRFESGAVHDAADARIRVPMRPSLRSLNVAVAAAMILGEALRQTGGFPTETTET
jgi:hypothetical protein